MKYQSKIVFSFFLSMALLSCSEDDSPTNTENNLDITRYAIGGKMANNRLGVLTFEQNNIARLKDVDQDRTYSYSVEYNTVAIETIGTFKIENNELINVDVNLDFSEVTLLNVPAENAFLNTGYSGTIENLWVSEPFFTRFSGQEGVFRFGSGELLATPNKMFFMLNTISGYYQAAEISDIFFISNGKLVYERRITINGLPTNYFYASGLDRIP